LERKAPPFVVNHYRIEVWNGNNSTGGSLFFVLSGFILELENESFLSLVKVCAWGVRRRELSKLERRMLIGERYG